MKIVFFNHKGGVSKTTTAYNLGWMLGILEKKVLLVDADPQCNLSGLVLGDEFDKYYTEDTTKEHNIKDGVKMAFGGKPIPIQAVDCYSPDRNKNLYLLAGHANLSEYDASLSLAQNSNNAISALQNLPGAFNELINKTSEKYEIDFVLIDLNPGLSAINQNLFILSDGFLIPTNPDPFSIMALDTLSKVLPKWVDWADRMKDLFADAAYPLSNSRPKFIGGLIQRFNIRNGKAAKPYRENIADIQNIMQTKLFPSFEKARMLFDNETYQIASIPENFCLAEIPDFQGLLPKANEAGVPVFAITDEEIHEAGEVKTGLMQNREKFYAHFEKIANQLILVKDNAKIK
ncbi:MAG: AAA family ATPase [Campylobacterales bacterium]|nr:AAA family ATPase [Campylobacterales bacterium]